MSTSIRENPLQSGSLRGSPQSGQRFGANFLSSLNRDIGSSKGRRIVDAVAGHCYPSAFRLESLDHGRLLLRQDLGLHGIDADRPSHGLGGDAAIAGEHYDAESFFVQGFDRFGGRRLDPVRHTDQAGIDAVHRHEHHRLTIPSQGIRTFR